MAKAKGRSATPDDKLSLYQLHCRYSRLEGLEIATAAELWADMKGNYPTREAHMSALFTRLRYSPLGAAQDPAAASDGDSAAKEGREYIEEARRRSRDATMTQCRLELDQARCRHCDFYAPRAVFGPTGPVPLAQAVVDIEKATDLFSGSALVELTRVGLTCQHYA